MKASASKIALCAFAIAGSAVASAAQPLAGLSQQYAYIAPASFISIKDGGLQACPLEFGTGFYTNACTSGSGNSLYTAPLDLPEGSIFLALQVWYLDQSTTNSFSAFMSEIDAPIGGSTFTSSPMYNPAVHGISFDSGVQTSDGLTHFATISPDLTFTINSWDTSRSPSEHMSYSIFVTLPVNDKNVGFAGALVSFQRQIGPEPAVASFGDVPTSHPFFNEIEQLKKSGITLGCGNGNFCPDSPVTRGQMAAFLSRALGLQWDANTSG